MRRAFALRDGVYVDALAMARLSELRRLACISQCARPQTRQGIASARPASNIGTIVQAGLDLVTQQLKIANEFDVYAAHPRNRHSKAHTGRQSKSSHVQTRGEGDLVLNRISTLKVGTRFMLLGALALVLAAVPSAMYLHTFHLRTQTATHEASGIAPSRTLLRLVQLLQRHRGLTAMTLDGNSAVLAERDTTAQEIDARFKELSNLLGREVDRPELRETLNRSEQTWHAVRDRHVAKESDFLTNFDQHTEVIKYLLHLSGELNHEFGFATDQGQTTHVLINLAMMIVPAMTEELGRSRAMGSHLLAATAPTPTDRDALHSYLTLVEYQLSALKQELTELESVDASLAHRLLGPTREATELPQQALDLAHEQLIYRVELGLSPAQYFEIFTRTIDAIVALSDRAMDQLDISLSERVAADRAQALLALLAMLATAGLGIGLGWITVVSITRELGGEPGEVMAVVKAVAQGNLSSEITVPRGAEHSILAAISDMQAVLRGSKERYQHLIESMPLGVMITQNGIIKFCNPMAIEMSGYAASELIGHPFLPLIHQDDRARTLDVHARRMRGEVDLLDYEVRVTRKDGKQRLWRLRVQTIEWDGAPAGLSILTDNTERKETEIHLHELSSIVEQTHDAIMLTDAAGTIKYVNPGFEHLSGWNREEVLGKTPALFKSGAQDEHFYRQLWDTIAAGKPFQSPVINRHKNGSDYHVFKTITPMFDADGKIASYVNIDMDFGVQHEAQKRLAFQALHDNLTGLPNRSLLDDRVRQTIARDQRKPSPFALLFIDLDGFKIINDKLGHHVGDDVLKEVARRLQQVTRPMDTVARLGGDEFVVLVQGVSEIEQVEQIGQKLVDAIREPIKLKNDTCQLGASIGVSLYPTDGTALQTLLDSADAAMYRAKRAGGNRLQQAELPPPGSPLD